MKGLCLALIGLALASGATGAAENTEIAIASVGSGEKLTARLTKPDGAGPFPAVVILHDCSGLGPRSSGGPRRWASELAPQGYVVLIPDSFTARGFPDGVCMSGVQNRERADNYARAADAYGALAALRALPYAGYAEEAADGESSVVLAEKGELSPGMTLVNVAMASTAQLIAEHQ